jgi:hypothetical protein
MLSLSTTSTLLAVFTFFSTPSVPAGGALNKIVLTNDGKMQEFSVVEVFITFSDGWAVAQIRAQKDALTNAGFDVCSQIDSFLLITLKDFT